MRVGSVGYSTAQGLGVLLKDFHRHGIVNTVLTVKQPTREGYNWYNDTPTISSSSLKDKEVYGQFVKSVDVMFFFETSFLNSYKFCRANRVKTILMPMYECTPDFTDEEPDLILSPSELDREYYPGSDTVIVPIPDWVKWRQRTKAEVFVHNAGYGGLKGRNGTQELLEAMKYVKSPLKLIIRAQEDFQVPRAAWGDKRIHITIGTIPKEELYREGDVFVFPEKFNGLSLPLQEAKASGMLIMASDRFPINTWNSSESLIPIRKYEHTKPWKKIVKTAVVDPKDIAATMDYWYGKDITQFSEEGRIYREENSWEELKPIYMNYILKLAIK